MQINILDIAIDEKVAKKSPNIVMILTFDHIDNDTVLSVVCWGTSVVTRVRRSGLLKHAPLLTQSKQK